MIASTPDPGWLPFHPSPSKPRFLPRPGAVDAHCLVFGPGARFPYAPERKYTPCDAGKEELWNLRRFLEFERNVIVQAICHGTDNRALVDALEDSGGSARGVAAVRRDVTENEAALHHEDVVPFARVSSTHFPSACCGAQIGPTRT